MPDGKGLARKFEILARVHPPALRLRCSIYFVTIP